MCVNLNCRKKEFFAFFSKEQIACSFAMRTTQSQEELPNHFSQEAGRPLRLVLKKRKQNAVMKNCD